MAYDIRYASAASKTIERLPREMQQRVLNRLGTLADEPRPQGCTKLSGRDEYRIRVGDYRVIYTIADTQLIVLVIDVGHRRDVYRR